jgi:hypothetical protein
MREVFSIPFFILVCSPFCLFFVWFFVLFLLFCGAGLRRRRKTAFELHLIRFFERLHLATVTVDFSDQDRTQQIGKHVVGGHCLEPCLFVDADREPLRQPATLRVYCLKESTDHLLDSHRPLVDNTALNAVPLVWADDHDCYLCLRHLSRERDQRENMNYEIPTTFLELFAVVCFLSLFFIYFIHFFGTNRLDSMEGKTISLRFIC